MGLKRAQDEAQTLFIPDWLPPQTANSGAHSQHWSVTSRHRQDAARLVRLYARAEGWRPVAGRARLRIVFVYPRRYRVDADGIASRCKGLIDGLVRGGYLVDDDTEHLTLSVGARVEKGVKGVEMVLSGAA